MTRSDTEGTTDMKIRFTVLMLLTIIVVSGATSVAASMPSRCPSDTHISGDPTWCLSNEQHAAPSGTGYLPNYATQKDARIAVRVELLLGGLVVGGTLLVAAFREQRRPILQPATAS
jgi:hypothetical protein